MKIYLLDAINKLGVAKLQERADVVLPDDPEIAGWREHAEGIILRGATFVTAADLDQCKCLKAISKHGTGVDRIDLEAAKDKGVVVMNTPSLNADAVSEMAVALALAVGRHVVFADHALRIGQDIRREDFDGSAAGTGGRGMEGKTVGVVGLGAIGRKVVDKWRLGFNMTVLGFDPHLPDEAWETIPCERIDALSDLLHRVDLLCLHVPLTPQTKHLIGANELAQMKPEAILVNLARGGVVDEDALYQALVNKQLFGAALDVFEQEPPIRHKLFGLQNFVGTPHIGGGTQDSREQMALMVAEQLMDALDGEPPRNRVA